jgi:hypothetical protein
MEPGSGLSIADTRQIGTYWNLDLGFGIWDSKASYGGILSVEICISDYIQGSHAISTFISNSNQIKS